MNIKVEISKPQPHNLPQAGFDETLISVAGNDTQPMPKKPDTLEFRYEYYGNRKDMPDYIISGSRGPNYKKPNTSGISNLYFPASKEPMPDGLNITVEALTPEMEKKYPNPQFYYEFCKNGEEKIIYNLEPGKKIEFYTYKLPPVTDRVVFSANPQGAKKNFWHPENEFGIDGKGQVVELQLSRRERRALKDLKNELKKSIAKNGGKLLEEFVWSSHGDNYIISYEDKNGKEHILKATDVIETILPFIKEDGVIIMNSCNIADDPRFKRTVKYLTGKNENKDKRVFVNATLGDGAPEKGTHLTCARDINSETGYKPTDGLILFHGGQEIPLKADDYINPSGKPRAGVYTGKTFAPLTPSDYVEVPETPAPKKQ